MNKLPQPPKGRQLEWAPYIVPEDGHAIWSLRKLKWLKTQKNAGGYPQVWITPYEDQRGKGLKPRWYRISRLVAFLYVPNSDPSIKVCVGHKDDNPEHNHYTNLYWCTQKQNIQDSFDKGRRAKNLLKGEEHPNFGSKRSAESKSLMSRAKMGEKHPKFKGYYIHQGERYTSLNELAKAMGTYSVNVHRLHKKGLIEFEPIQKAA